MNIHTVIPRPPSNPGRPGVPESPRVPLHPSAPGFPRGPDGPGWPWWDITNDPELVNPKLTIKTAFRSLRQNIYDIWTILLRRFVYWLVLINGTIYWTLVSFVKLL